ncbi:MAG: hypothetical protein GAK28_00577 [Luteibacter sp.]|uniref:hypothetical protein n=1 Tax=Luteibacter sp. TaxID=1886636 RepID=UPI001382E8D2|nr:hypothetical protein [Luteibacter sp.]KAF1008945.1 MAG: hypothetical protein GAK28_00577 [Luteibacter sp.]
MNTPAMTLEEALQIADQACPLPALGGQALRVLRARLELLEGEVAAYHGNAASKPTSGVARIAAERTRQILTEGWSTQHDRKHGAGELACAACVYTLATVEADIDSADVLRLWPWTSWWWKPSTPVRNLEKAGALIAAEIDRLTFGQEQPT